MMKFTLQQGQMLPFVDGAIDRTKDAMIESFHESITAFFVALTDIIQELSYSIALLGGGICLIVWTITKITKVKQVGLLLVLVHVFVRYF